LAITGCSGGSGSGGTGGGSGTGGSGTGGSGTGGGSHTGGGSAGGGSAGGGSAGGGSAGGGSAGGGSAGGGSAGGGSAGGGSAGGGSAGGGSAIGNDIPDAGPNAIAATCTTYCTTIQTNCTGANAQWSSAGACQNACLALPAGMTSDTTGGTMGCRAYHATAAATAAAVHCTHAGPTGGYTDDAANTPGTCGDGCDAFCRIALSVCTGANAQYTGATPYADCYSDCTSFAELKVVPYSTADTGTDDYGCRMYHLSVAATDSTSAGVHCPHIVSSSSVCVN
jgi:hypothetical protein